jgi:hypothetical protein
MHQLPMCNGMYSVLLTQMATARKFMERERHKARACTHKATLCAHACTGPRKRQALGALVHHRFAAWALNGTLFERLADLVVPR